MRESNDENIEHDSLSRMGDSEEPSREEANQLQTKILLCELQWQKYYCNKKNL